MTVFPVHVVRERYTECKKWLGKFAPDAEFWIRQVDPGFCLKCAESINPCFVEIVFRDESVATTFKIWYDAPPPKDVEYKDIVLCHAYGRPFRIGHRTLD